MSLQRRLLLYLLLCAPLVWAVAAWTSVQRARDEIDELFDTEMVRLARQLQAGLQSLPATVSAVDSAALPRPADVGAADVEDLALAVWDAQGRALLADREGAQLPRRDDAFGFIDERIGGEAWRVYHLPSVDSRWRVAVGQRVAERGELSQQLVGSQLVVWGAMLPVLLLAMALAVRQALAPLNRLAHDVHRREAGDLQPIDAEGVPVELQPLAAAMNGLFRRVDDALARERRFTADAAHELRTPLTVLRLQWDVLQGARDDAERAEAVRRLGAGLERMDRLVAQLLALSRVEAAAAAPPARPIDWTKLVARVVDDVLPLADLRQVELACEWADEPGAVLPLRAEEDLIAALLRNLVDNAVRYAPGGSTVVLRLAADRVEVDNDGAPLPVAVLDRLGERFYRPEGQAESGSGLGVSIVRRIAALYGLQVSFGARDDGTGVRVVLIRAPS
ncbi:MAG: sensor histidine kinase N-terminal domain-containing protein [Burkholderiaceae bacterium]|jgi:two-component system sensor histidine kinase QseC|nr:sensor histidine kinase N-terminal domain-containing protein [Burkholderiaceae bacterium]